jgi:DNA-binding NtrC family response regulator
VAYILSSLPEESEKDMYPAESMRTRNLTASQLKSKAARTRILVFSPDPDLARSLSLLLEDRFEIACEIQLENLKKAILANAPALLLIDLFSFPSDILREVNVLRATQVKIPVVLLRVYRQLSPELEEKIRDLADLVLYKPFDVNVVADAIYRLLDVE